MKKVLMIYISILSLMLSGCSPVELIKSAMKDPLVDQLKTSSRIVLTNTKENTLRITVSDSQVISQIVSIVGKRKKVNDEPGVESDYNIKFYLSNGTQMDFEYWMGSSENGKEVNFRDADGNLYRIPESMDMYIISSTKMQERPKNFVELYSTALSECISKLEKSSDGTTVVGVDTTSDRRLRKYTKSYEDKKILESVDAEGYTIVPYEEHGEYTYIITYVTDIYGPEKASISVDALNVGDRTVQTFDVNYVLLDGIWQHPPEED